jgi:hypothetical protein
LIIFFKYQTSPRFIKAIAHPLCHPTIERESIESNHAPVLHEGNLPPADAVVQRVDAHAQVARRRIDVQPTRFDDGILRPFAWFHTALQTPEQLCVVRCRDAGLSWRR